MKPLVSIICITYNHEKFIAQALDGFVMQKTDFPFEVIIHDDASTDGTAKIIKQYEKKYPKIFKAIYEDKNQYSSGSYEFINDMLRQAQGDFVAVCEGDDYWTDEQKLQIQVDYLNAHPKDALCFHPVQVKFDDDPKKTYLSPNPVQSAEFTNDELIKRNFIQTNGVLYRKQDYRKMPDNVMPHDWYLHLYHAKFGTIGFINRVMAVYRIHKGGVWSESYSDMDAIWQKHGVSWLRLYLALLEIYGNVPSYRLVLEGNIINLLKTLREIDKKYDQTLFDQSAIISPKSVAALVDNLGSAVKSLDEHAKKQATIIKHYTDMSEDLSRRNEQLERELVQYKKKRLVRLEENVRNRIKRKPA